MTRSTAKIFHFVKDPVRLSLICLALFIILILSFHTIQWMGGMATERTAWLLAASTTLLYSMFNAIFLFFSEDLKVYWQKSIYSYIGLAFITGLLAWSISGLSLNEIGNFRSVLLVLAIAFFTFLVIVTTVRRLVEFSRKRDREKLSREESGQATKND